MYCVLKRQTHFGQKMQEKTTLEKTQRIPYTTLPSRRTCPALSGVKIQIKPEITPDKTPDCPV